MPARSAVQGIGDGESPSPFYGIGARKDACDRRAPHFAIWRG
jgi:hypothetical protein